MENKEIEKNITDGPDSYVLEDSEETSPGQPGNRKSPFLLMLEILFNPVVGWKSLRRAKITAETMQSECFYPLLAILAVSEFAQLFYSSSVTLSEVLIDAVVSFVSFFAGYYCIMLALELFLPKEAKVRFNTEFGKVFVLTALSTLCLFFIAIELLPILWSLLIFLPLWTVYVICRGVRFFIFPENCKLRSTIILCLLTIGVPSLIDWALKEMI